MNREEWLISATGEVSTLLTAATGDEMPEVHVSVGWPSKGGTSLRKRRVGECWRPETSEDGKSHIFLSPTIVDPVQLLGILIHELIHAWDKGEHAHRGPFIEAAKAVGLTPKWTATGVGDDLRVTLQGIADRLGEYPHSRLTPGVKEKSQTTRMLKLECPECGYVVRTTQKWLDVGVPSCPEGDEMIQEVKP